MLAISVMPAGTLTLLFTDIEGSTSLWDEHPEAMRVALARHDALVRAAIFASNGQIFKTVGDAFCAAFALASDAVAAALAAQRAIGAEPWPETALIKVRMALHTGAVESRDDDYFGAPLNRVARLLATGHGGQTLLSQTTYDLVRDSLPDAVSLHDLGAHKLRDLARPEQVFQLQHPGLRSDFPPIRSLSTHPNNLPQQLTSFIGREKEIAEVKALLARKRLVTLTGSGGSGKTRLCLQVAADALEEFPDGAWFVEFAPLAEPALVSQTVAAVLGVRETLGKTITEALVLHLEPKRLLLLFDNCEHVLDACAAVADAIMRQCPGAKILATSREALGCAGEQSCRVPSLSLPDSRHVQTLRTLTTYESVRLFIDRALLVRADFRITNQNAPALASVCCRLDGIPLAIELAAARVRTLSVDEIDGRLDQRFRLLTGGARTALPRQQTLRSLIDWSYDLLQQAEKRLLQRLSVFAGGWTLRAAEEVCGGDSVANADVLDLLTSLADKSLVVAELCDGHSRYTLLETVRQYAREKLHESGGGEAVGERHRDYFLSLAEEASSNRNRTGQSEWLQRLEDEHENLRAGLAWSFAEAGSGGGLRLCGALRNFWLARGHHTEGREWCSRALDRAGQGARTRECAKVLSGVGALAYMQGDFTSAREHHEACLSIMRELGDLAGIAGALNNIGLATFDLGDYSAARARYEESLAILRELGDPGGIAAALNNLGRFAIEQADYTAARALFEESLAIDREQGNRGGVAISLGNLGEMAYLQGDYATATALHEESLAIERQSCDPYAIAHSLGNLANVAHDQGNYPAAGALFREGLAILRELGDRHGIAHSLERLPAVIAAVGDSPRAARIWGAAERLREEIGSPLPPADRPRYNLRVAAARAAPGDGAAFDRAWQEGRSLPVERAIELALDNPEQTQ